MNRSGADYSTQLMLFTPSLAAEGPCAMERRHDALRSASAPPGSSPGQEPSPRTEARAKDAHVTHQAVALQACKLWGCGWRSGGARPRASTSSNKHSVLRKIW
eukprot:6460343-Prymnesium_polylepis.1